MHTYSSLQMCNARIYIYIYRYIEACIWYTVCVGLYVYMNEWMNEWPVWFTLFAFIHGSQNGKQPRAEKERGAQAGREPRGSRRRRGGGRVSPCPGSLLLLQVRSRHRGFEASRRGFEISVAFPAFGKSIFRGSGIHIHTYIHIHSRTNRGNTGNDFSAVPFYPWLELLSVTRRLDRTPAAEPRVF